VSVYQSVSLLLTTSLPVYPQECVHIALPDDRHGHHNRASGSTAVIRLAIFSVYIG